MKRTAEIEGFWRTPILFSRPLHGLIRRARLNPSDKSLGYFHVVRSADEMHTYFLGKAEE